MADVWPRHFGNQSYNDSEKPEVDVDAIVFGGGHTQRVPNSINYIRMGITLRLTRKNDLANEIYAWVLPRARLTPFYCEFPDATPGNYICEEISKTWAGPNHTTLTLALKQDFGF